MRDATVLPHTAIIMTVITISESPANPAVKGLPPPIPRTARRPRHHRAHGAAAAGDSLPRTRLSNGLVHGTNSTTSGFARPPMGGAMGAVASKVMPPAGGDAKSNLNLKMVALLPVSAAVSVFEFAERLRASLELIGVSADCILFVGLGDEDSEIGDYERVLIAMKTTAKRKLYYSRALGTAGFARRESHSLNTQTGIRSDFARLARRLLNKSIGLVLGGGGARGIAHVGIIKAFEEAGIPIDMVGGTSIGSFVGGIYARETDSVSCMARVKSLSSKMTSVW
ncbi:phosphatidylcholine and lysophosphatidylcholine phospholipase [Cladochytrium tenue]|nr:phosphatidylcholine and lysophosphatidylcholine phospholipase [Cladochytrium tenue]